jgi:multimeric flavodoxin WrbA
MGCAQPGDDRTDSNEILVTQHTANGRHRRRTIEFLGILRAHPNVTIAINGGRSMYGSHIKVLAINGSARKGGNTAILLHHVMKELELEGIETEFIELSGLKIHRCVSCRKCRTNRDGRCAESGDMGNILIEKMAQADGILFGSPTYLADVSPEIKSLMDRACQVAKANDGMFRHKVGAAVVSVRRAGAIHTFDALNHFFLINEMIVPGSSYWNIGIGREIGDVEMDAEGIATMKTLGRNMAWLLENLKNPMAIPELAEIVSQ